MTQSLVTGGAGFIGSHLVEALVARGERVRVLDNFSTGKRANLAAVASEIEVIGGDIRDPAAVRAAMEGVERVFHQAALVSVPRSVEDPAANHSINVDGTFNLLEAARGAHVSAFIYASSAAVYGDLPGLPKTEDMPLAPASPYGLAKRIGEEYVDLYARLYGVPGVCLRYFNVYGPRQDPRSPYSGVISIFIERLLEGNAPTIYGDGEQTRDFIYVADVVHANLLAADAAGAGGIYNVCTGEATSVSALWREIQAIAGVYVKPRFAPARPGDVRHSVASYERARVALGFTPEVRLNEGLRRTLRSVLAARGLK
jgi:UDP-glucose 4-epimerase